MAPNKRGALTLLPPMKELAALTPQKMQIVMDLIDREADREFKYAWLSMLSGTACLTASLIIFTYLVMKNHETAAGVVFGTTILGLIGKIVFARLQFGTLRSRRNR